MNKKELYESIMRNVSREIKKALNEQYDFYNSIQYDGNQMYFKYSGDNSLYNTANFDLYSSPVPDITCEDAIKILSLNFPFDFSETFRFKRWFNDSDQARNIFWKEMAQPEYVINDWFLVKRGNNVSYLHFGDVRKNDMVLAWGDNGLIEDYLGYYMSIYDIDLSTINCPSEQMDIDNIENYKSDYDKKYGK